MNAPPLRALLVVEDIPWSDRLFEELTAAGFEVQATFSAAEAVGTLQTNRTDAVVVDADLEEADLVRHWLKWRHKGVVCLVHEFDGAVGELTMNRQEFVAEAEGAAEAEDVVARLLSGLAAERALLPPPGYEGPHRGA
jgi:ActR/RegA family two-component response regulator